MGALLSYPAIHPERDVVLAASAARTATLTGDTMVNHHARGLLLTVVVGSVTATPSLTPKVQYSYDDGTTWVDYVVVTAALTAAGTAAYLIYPEIDPSADGALTESFNLPLPRVWRVVVTAADSDSATYAVYGQYL